MSPADRSRSGRRRPVLRFIVTVAISLGLLMGLLWLTQRRLIYFPIEEVPPITETLPGARIILINTSDGLDLTGWFLSVPDPKAAVLILNGNAGNRSHRAALAQALVDAGYEVLMFDYRGYGGNDGSPSEEGLAIDAVAALGALTELATTDRLVLVGESLGAAVAARLAVDRPPAALVLRSPFPSLAAVAAVHYPFIPASLLLRDRYETIEAVKRINAPILVVAGSADTIVPAHLSRAVYAAARGDAQWILIDGADHNDATLSYGPPLLEAISRFLDRVL
ncbi:MAG: alpha/beta hydrolase [Acidimicrobiia bacterium]